MAAGLPLRTRPTAPCGCCRGSVCDCGAREPSPAGHAEESEEVECGPVRREAEGEAFGARRGEPQCRDNRTAGVKPDRTSLYREITDKIIAELEEARVPWVRPWGAAKVPLGMPQNAATGQRYRGINVLLLWDAVTERGFAGQTWLTYRQARSLGANVRKGERGTTITGWPFLVLATIESSS